MGPNNQQEPEPDRSSFLSNVFKVLTRFFSDTAVLLTLFTAVLYTWGEGYYDGFIKGLGLQKYTFAFNISAEERLFGGANLLYYVIIYGSVIICVLFTLIAILLRIDSNIFNKITRWLKKYPELTYWGKSIVYSLLLLLPIGLLIQGVKKSGELGKEGAQAQRNSNLNVEVIHGENDTIKAMLHGRIGSDYILQLPKDAASKDTAGRYIILKESAIKAINLIKQIPVAPQAARAER